MYLVPQAVVLVDELFNRINRVEWIRSVTEGFERPWPEETGTISLIWILSLIIEPLSFYIPVINDEEKMLDFHKNLVIAVAVLSFYINFPIYQYFRYKTTDGGNPKLWKAFVIGVPLLHLLINGALLLFIFLKAPNSMNDTLFSLGTAFYFLMYLSKVLEVYRWTIAKLRNSALRRIGVNLLLYILGGHVFGGLWYFLAVWRKMQCWSKACRSHGGCYYSKRRFFVVSGDKSFLDDMCFNSIKDTTNDLGIFKDAIESKVLETSILSQKLFYCIRWGVQNLSGFGQNLEIGLRVWENIYVLAMAVYGMITFTFFIGTMQNLFSQTRKDSTWTQGDLEKWSPFRKLSAEDKNSIIENCRRCYWPQTGPVNLRNLLTNPRKEEAENNIKRVLCSTLLRKINVLRRWDNELIDELCDYSKPVCYEENTYIVKKENPIFEMLLVVEGALRISNYRSENCRTTYVEYDGIYGEQLIVLLVHPTPSPYPVSDRDIRVVRQIHGFLITFYDLQSVINRQAAASAQNC